ncbi:MAG: hypothetical protein Q9219_000827 [cf. Caloplaca sp. 3 TL-2023]
MGLVEYSESEGSDGGESQEIQNQKVTSKTGKPAFQKVVDRSNPHKIRVNLPELESLPAEDKQNEDEPPAKKARTGGESFSGFNSFLPAPKRPAAGKGGLNGAGARKGGLGSGISLRTGSAPGFSREPFAGSGQTTEEVSELIDGENSLPVVADPSEHDITEKSGSLDLPVFPELAASKQEPTKQGNPIMFKPLSVARKSQKKNPAAKGEEIPTPKDNLPPQKPKARPKVSLFSAEPSRDNDRSDDTNGGTYKPMIYGATGPDVANIEQPQAQNPYTEEAEPTAKVVPKSNVPIQGPQSLDAIASDLNLSASAKRQLFGRQKPNSSAINIVNFNTDQEYAANELLRQAGEQVQHNPVRAIAPGKHSLKQLVNAASNQKDALEEQFASGRRNKKEAGNRYGW